MYLLDTNTIIDYLKGSLPAGGMLMVSNVADTDPAMSVISKIELLGFRTPAQNEEALAEAFVEGSMIFNLTEDIINQTIILRKLHSIKLPDAIIAATALVNNLTIITRNISDFDKIPGLKYVNPHLL
jgi:predicted nucleic acid-binding protein